MPQSSRKRGSRSAGETARGARNEMIEDVLGAAAVKPLLDGRRLLRMQELARNVIVALPMAEYVASIILATHPDSDAAPAEVKRFVRFGSSPRGGQSMILAAKARAFMDGRVNASFKDLQAVALPALRHRLILNFEGEAEGVTTDDVLDAILRHVKT